MKLHNDNSLQIAKDSEKLLSKIYITFSKAIKTSIVSCYETLDDTLFDLAEKADNNQKQSLYFESMRTIRQQRKKLITTFFSSIKSTFLSYKKQDFDYFSENTGYNPKIKSLSLSLIDEKELDETLATTNLINKSEMAYHRQLFALKKRFTALSQFDKEISTNQIPISPFVIVNSFAKSIKSLDTDVTLKLIIYKLFERTVMGQLLSSYQQINDLFSTAGVIPEISYNIGRNSPSQLSAVAAPKPNNTEISNNSDVETGTNLPPTQQNQNHQQEALVDSNYQLISQLFNTNRQESQEGSNKNPQNTNSGNADSNQFFQQAPVQNIDLSSMMNALSILQGDVFKNIPINETSKQSPTEIKDALIKQLHKLDDQTKDQKVRQKDEDTIDLVGMLFQFIVDDRNLPDAIQVILVKLQIPYLKIALQDRNLFATKTHPARVLLDKMSIASIGWTQESDHKNLFINKIEDISKSILNLEDYQEEMFLNLIKEFDKFSDKLKKKSEVIQKRTKEKSLGQDKIAQAKKRSAQLLIDKMTNKQMPILIRNVLLGEWSNVLILMHLRHDPESDEFLEKIKFVDNIIEYSSPKTGTIIEKRDIEDVSNLYKKGLALVAFNPKEQIDKIDELVKCLSEIHDLSNENIPSNVDIIAPEDILKLSDIKNEEHEIVDFIEDILTPKDVEEEIVEDKYSEQISQLKTGDWLEFIRNGKNIRAKLSWISPITGKYLFVNSRGLKITDKTKSALVNGLKEKNIRILQQVALFDRALSAIATKLNNT